MSALHEDIPGCVSILKYYAGWCDKIHGKTIEVCSTYWASTYSFERFIVV